MSSPAAPDHDRSARLSDTALSALALDRQPFATSPADGDAFADDITAEQLADIRQALITGDDLLLVLGEDGAGKSTLLAQLAANGGLRIQCFSVDGGPRFSTRNLFMGMLEAFKVEPSDDLERTLDELIPCLQAMVASNKLCVVVLDDAQAIAANELTTLLGGMLYVNSRDESLLRIALAAPPEFEERIPDLLPEGADLPYSSLSLEPFDAPRAADYLAFRLARAGRDDALPFDEGEIAELNDRAGGRPGALHALAAAALENAHGVPGAHAAAVPARIEHEDDLPPELREAPRPRAAAGLDGRAVKLALGTLAGLLIVGGLLLFRTGPEPGENEARYRLVEERKVETARETERLRLLEETEPARGDAAEDVPPADDERVALAPSTDDPSRDAATEELDGPDRRASDDPAAAAPATASPGGAAEAAAAPESAPEPLAEPPSEPTSGADGAGADDPEADGDAAPTADTASGATPSRSSPDGTASPSPDEAVPEPAAPEPAAETPAAVATAPDPDAPAESAPTEDVALLDVEEGAPSPVAPEPLADGVLESPNWVLVQDADRYTVQMSASTERASIEEFLARADLPAPNSIFSFERNGTTWYALVHGLYASVPEARDAIERMPEEALTDQPWIRAVGRIQDAMREQD